MKNLVKFILFGLLFSAYPGEIANQIIVHRTLQGFAGTMAIYMVLLTLGYWINKLFQRKLIPTLLYFVLFGVIGLLIEYLIVGQGPEASTVGMFTFWAMLFTLPRIFSDDSGQFEDLKKKITKYWFVSSPLVLLIFLIPPIDTGTYFGILAFLVQVMGFYVFYVSYLACLKRLERQETRETS